MNSKVYEYLNQYAQRVGEYLKLQVNLAVQLKSVQFFRQFQKKE